MKPGRIASRSGGDEPTIPAFVTTAVRLIISVHRVRVPPWAEEGHSRDSYAVPRYLGHLHR